MGKRKKACYFDPLDISYTIHEEMRESAREAAREAIYGEERKTRKSKRKKACK